ncbi:MAG: DUF2306 domain-containing protein [Saprospiraceae bacterium]
MKKVLWVLLVITALCIGIYPLIYFFIDETFGLLMHKSSELLANAFWRLGFYTHITLGGLALLIGWVQFSKKLRRKYLLWHRRIGKLYVFSVLLSGISGVGVAFYSTGGLITQIGFQLLGIIWLATTILGFITARNQQILAHQKWMIYSYAACFSAVTLRIWLPLLTIYFQGDFIQAYLIVAWLAWVPNLIVAYFITKRLTPNVSLG